MKTISPTDLANRLQVEPMFRVDLFSILCNNGLWLAATSGQNDLYFPSALPAYPPYLPPTYVGSPFPVDPFIYYATANGRWERGPVKSKASFNLGSDEMKLTVIADPTVLYPGTETPLFEVISTGVFDGASIAVGKMFMPLGLYGQGQRNDIGIEKVFSGLLGPFDQSGRTKFSWRVQDYRYLLNQKTPLRVIQSNCPWTLYTSACTVNADTYANPGIVGSTINALTGTLGALVVYAEYDFTVPSPPYYDQGIITFVSGQNDGLWYSIQTQQSDGGLRLVTPTIFPVAPGDEIIIIPGCDKTPATCSAKFDNLINFGGSPFTPQPESGI